MGFSPDELPNRFDFQTAEPRIYARWEANGCFHSEPRPGKKRFSIVIPPPNVTGALHLGHGLNNTLQDVLVRMKRMQGFETLWMPGTDHAGIATQAVVEKRLKEQENLTRHDLGREKLIERIWQWKHEYEARILGQLRKLGASCDWERTRFTLDPMCARAVRYTFFDLFQKNLIYRGKRLVNWDTHLQTAVSDDEVFPLAIKGSFWHIRYPVVGPKPGEPTHVVVATTRPETMLGDTAVAVHPHPAKALDKVEADLRERLDKAPAKEKPALQTQLDRIAERRAEMLPSLELLAKMAADGRMLVLPLRNREIPLVADEWAKPELGIGCVKITPAHDPNDFEVGKRRRLPIINILRVDGTLNENAGAYAGMSMQAARKAVVKDLEDQDYLVEVEAREIELPHSDRSKTPIEPFLADQWFVRMDQLAQSAMDAVSDGRIQFVPSRYASSYLDWLGEKRDWPVSRQLWWGHQIPVWSKTTATEADTRAVVAALEKMALFRSGAAVYQVESPAEQNESLGGGLVTSEALPHAVIHVCIQGADHDSSHAGDFEALGFVREQDVLDTWFSSALWPHSTLGWPEKTAELAYYYPTSALITSRDIITLWVARMALMGLNNLGRIPFHEVFIHPKILDGYGETMSKSKGNGIDPLDVIAKFGADALRFGMVRLTTETQDVRLPVQFECPRCEHLVDQTRENREKPRVACSKCGEPFSTQWARSEADLALPRAAVVSERFEQCRNFTNKLWNAARLILLNLNDFEPTHCPVEELRVGDRWMLSRLQTVTAETTAALESYKYSEAARILYAFAWDEFCSFYLEILKERLVEEESKPDGGAAARRVAQTMVAHALDQLLRLLHPMMPFVTEEIWQLLAQVAPVRGYPKPERAVETIMLAPWPTPVAALVDRSIEEQFALFQQTIGALREIRSRQSIPPRKELEFSLRCSPEAAALLEPMRPYFSRLASATIRQWGPDVAAPATSATVSLTGLTVAGAPASVDVFVDLKDFIDVDAEIARNEKLVENLTKVIAGKEKKLSDEKFASKAPPDIVAKERASLDDAKAQLAQSNAALVELRKRVTKA